MERDEVPVQTVETPAAGAPSVLQELYALLREIDVQGPIESLHDAAQFFADAQAQYAMGLLDLPQRAYAERAYYALARAVLPKLDLSIRAQRDAYDELREKLSAKYFCNFRSEEHTSELQSLMRISYAVFCLKQKKQKT